MLKLKSTQIHLIVITALFWTISIFIFRNLGVKYVTDSERFLEYATSLSRGFYFDPHNFWYIGYVFFLLLIRLVSDDYIVIIALQYAISYLAVLALYRTVIILLNQPVSAFMACLLYISFIELMAWNSYILAESLYASATCFSIYMLSLSWLKRDNYALFVAAVVVVIFTVLIKPTGVALLGALVAIFLMEGIKRLPSRQLRWGASILILLLFMTLVNRMLTTYKIMENYQKGEVIYALTTVADHQQYSSLLVTPPKNIYMPSDDTTPVLKVIYFIWHHPLYWTELFLTKLFFFLAHIRPYWSVAHNIFSLVFLLPVYVLTARTFARGLLPPRMLIFGGIYIAIHTLSICITSEDWDGRFLVPLLPVLFIFTSISAHDLLSALTLSFSKNK